jgi:hypothetical protein
VFCNKASTDSVKATSPEWVKYITQSPLPGLFQPLYSPTDFLEDIWISAIASEDENQMKAIELTSGSLLLALALTCAPAIAQTAGQDMKNAGTDTKNAAKDAGHGVKTGTVKAYDKTASGTKTAYHKTANGTNTAYHKTETGTKTATHKTVDGTKTVGKDIGHGTKVGAEKTVDGTKKLGDKIAGKPTPQ